MPTFKNMDACLPFLKDKLAQEREPIRRAGIKIAIDIMTALPSEEVQEGIICRDCFFYNKAEHKCNHKNGLMGRVRPQMYCSYGSYHHEAVDDDDEDFSEFDEEE